MEMMPGGWPNIRHGAILAISHWRPAVNHLPMVRMEATPVALGSEQWPPFASLVVQDYPRLATGTRRTLCLWSAVEALHLADRCLHSLSQWC
jgi:hypothetical protein